MRLINDFLGLFYPKLCLACGQNLLPRQHVICLSCHYHLPETNFEQFLENAFTEHFWGRLPVHTATSLFHYTKSGHTRRLIHQLKYNGKRQVGVQLGKMLGEKINKSPHFADVDMVIPVPLHPRKKKMRGYNQSDLIAQGIAESIKKPWSAKRLIRTKMTASQTKKNRMQRFENVETAFSVQQANALEKRHILLVDDVMTTGATLEACGKKIIEITGTKLSFATLAFANN